MERELVRKQILVEREKRERIDELKRKEKDEAAEGIRSWAVETLKKQRDLRIDSGVFESDQLKPQNESISIEMPGAETESQLQKLTSNAIFEHTNLDVDTDDINFVDDDDIDVEAIRLKVRNMLAPPEIPPPRQTLSIDVTFTSRDNIPTKTARETEDGY